MKTKTYRLTVLVTLIYSSLSSASLSFIDNQSGNFDTVCVSSHHPTLGGVDALSIAIGVDTVNPNLLGPGREHLVTAVNYDGSPTMPRNVPTSFDLSFMTAIYSMMDA
ncbi:hypothetical protein [Grimontia kaedaensis]|uniref:hypothetical protein n=1 Tax=Grimontia kaedaensis TaxID=2872157 RepID=UPI002072F91D|nr:hypothetical protein [Grimontia kaedaensis]